MIDTTQNEQKKPTAQDRFHDRMISLILTGIWVVGVVIVARGDSGISNSMLAIGTLFFVLLLPAMKELVKTLDRLVRGENEAD